MINKLIRSARKLVCGAFITTACILGVNAGAQTQQFSQATYLTVATNSSTLVTTPFAVQLPPIALTITATNVNTVITNDIITVVQVTNMQRFIYRAADYGTNFSTNWPGVTLYGTNITYGSAVPQAGGTNTAYIR